MANEPERPIEKLLRAAAQKRRDDAGALFELHPADRRLLQSEVARTFAPPQRQPRSLAQALAQLWVRLAGAVALLAVLGLAVWTLLPVPRTGKPELSLARNLPASKDMLAQEPQPLPTPTQAPLAPALAAAVKKESQLLAFADKQKPDTATRPGLLTATPSPVEEPNAVALRNGFDAPRLELATTSQFAVREEAAKPLVVAAGVMPAPAPTGVSGGALARRYGLPTQPARSANPAASSAGPTTVAMAPAPATVPLADGSATLVGALSRQPAAAPVAQPNESMQLTAGNSPQPGTYQNSLPTVAAANRPTPSLLPMDSLSKAAPEGLQQAKPLTVAQRFVQVPSETKAKGTLALTEIVTPAVLASFQVEQAGPVLRITDGDGSVYAGSLQLANAPRRARSAKADGPPASFAVRAPTRGLEQETTATLDSDSPAHQTYSFRVAGTNRSLQKKVVFTGNLLTATNLSLSLPATTNLTARGLYAGGNRRDTFSYGATNLDLQGGLGRSQTATTQPAFLPLLNSRISGKVVVGTGKPIEINALPASP
jgi:hypothetical protein